MLLWAANLHEVLLNTIIREFWTMLHQTVWVCVSGLYYVSRIRYMWNAPQSHSLLSMKGVTCASGIFTLIDHLTHHTKHSNAILGLLTVLFISSWQCGEWQSQPMVCQWSVVCSMMQLMSNVITNTTWYFNTYRVTVTLITLVVTISYLHQIQYPQIRY